MNQYVTGATIKELREKQGLTQQQLAEKLCVSDKTISKWETGRGYPDITLLEPIANTFAVSITELISGNIAANTNIAANMQRAHFYVCPVCGNVIHSIGESSISCHGVQLLPFEAEPVNETHSITIENIEGDYYIQIDHAMTKQHYISFAAAVSPDRIQLVKFYPEGNAETRFSMRGVHTIYFYCNRDGLFRIDTPRRRP